MMKRDALPFSRYLWILAAGFVGSAAAWLLLVAFQAGKPTESSRAWSEINLKKLSIARAMPSPKIVIAGGSNGHFGIEARAIEKAVGAPTVNLATNAGLGILYVLHLARRAVKAGDTLILTLEYDHYSATEVPNVVLVDSVWSRDLEYFWDAGFVTQLRFLFSMSFQRMAYGIRGALSPPPRKPQLYSAESITPHGDETVGRKAEARLEELKKTEPVDVAFYVWKEFHPPEASRFLAEFSAWCRRNQVRLLFAWPATIRPADLSSPKQQAALKKVEEFWTSLGVPVLGRAEDSFFAPESFFDTRYHLHDEARAERTRRLIQLLRARRDR